MNRSVILFGIIITPFSYIQSNPTIDSKMPDWRFSRIEAVLGKVKSPDHLKLYSIFRPDVRYSEEILKSFKKIGESNNTKVVDLHGQTSLDIRPLEQTVFNHLPYSYQHPWRLVTKTSVVSSVATIGAMKLYQAGYFDMAKKKFQNMVNYFRKK